MVSYANERDIAVNTTLNGTLIKEDIAKSVLNSGLSRIYISLVSWKLTSGCRSIANSRLTRVGAI